MKNKLEYRIDLRLDSSCRFVWVRHAFWSVMSWFRLETIGFGFVMC